MRGWRSSGTRGPSTGQCAPSAAQRAYGCVPVPSFARAVHVNTRVPPHWVSSEEAVMQYALLRVLPDVPPGGVLAGIDWAAASHAVCVVDAAGRVKDRFAAAHDKAGVAALIARLRRAGAAEVAIERSDGPL